MAVDEARGLFTHMEWADAVTWKTVMGLADAQKDARVADTLYHLHSVHWAYLQVWRGEPLQIPERGTIGDLAALLAWARPYYPGLRAFAETLDDAALSRPVELPWAGELVKRFGSVGPVTRGETILQVVMHSTYHRGQIATRIRELGGEPQITDFIMWVWLGRPEPEWTAGTA
jgi:uncharacterized damage-inducible protein DinB